MSDNPDDFGGGLPWDLIERISEAHANIIPNAMRLIVAMRGNGKMRAEIAQAAAMIKVTETKVSAIVQALPELFSFEASGSRIRLRTEPPDPWDLTKEQQKALEKRLKAAQVAQERAAAQAERDKLDTPYNRIRRGLMGLGFIDKDARAFGAMLMRTYPEAVVAEAIKAASDKSPAEPKSFIISVIRNRIGSGSNLASSRPNVVKSFIRPNPGAATQQIGWEDRLVNKVRNKLFRLPTGGISRSAPKPGEYVPTFQEDPGYRIEG